MHEVGGGNDVLLFLQRTILVANEIAQLKVHMEFSITWNSVHLVVDEPDNLEPVLFRHIRNRLNQ